MNLLLVGINHQTAPVAIRERVAFTSGEILPAIASLQKTVNIEEAVILSTCNRTEIIVSSDGANQQDLSDWLASYHQVAPNTLQDSLYSHTDIEAARHLMRVTSGLDSMVLGEPQITGQVKTAFADARQAGSVGSNLNRLFQQTFKIAKEVRSNTEIGHHLISMPAAALRLAKMLFTDLAQCRGLLVGVGDMIELSAKQLRDAGITELTIANRTIANAQSIAEAVEARIIGLDQLQDALPSFDIVISATGASLPIIGKGMIESALQKRKQLPMFLVDLAVPRDIESEVGLLRNAYLYSLDDLAQIVSENMALRQVASEAAESIIESGIDQFRANEQTRSRQDLVLAYRQQLETIKQTELNKALSKIDQGADASEVITALAIQLTQKYAHQPSVALRTFITAENHTALDIAQQLLGISQSDKDS